MRERYRKWGRVVRFEHGRIVRVEEAGEAIESAELFLASPIAERVPLPELDDAAVVDTARAIEALVRPERLLVSDGVAEHECNGMRWQERTLRVHASLVVGSRERALVDLDSFNVDLFRRIAGATFRDGRLVDRLRVAPHLAASLLPQLVGLVELEQRAGERDGKGLPIEARRVEGRPPNWYRPSYRVRPRRAWLNLRASTKAAGIDAQAPVAIATMAGSDPHRFRLLCLDGEELFPVVVDAAALLL